MRGDDTRRLLSSSAALPCPALGLGGLAAKQLGRESDRQTHRQTDRRTDNR